LSFRSEQWLRLANYHLGLFGAARRSRSQIRGSSLTSLLNVVMTDIAVAMMRVIVIMAVVMIVRVVVLS